jgi:L-iditol 2-dehydrogenase
MRALILYGPGDLRLEDVPTPVPGTQEIVVEIEAALTCATDAKMLRRGQHPSLGPVPAPFGHEGSGIVVATGPGVRAVSEGDAVVVANSAPCGRCEWCLRGREGLCDQITYLTGTYAEFLRVPAQIVGTNVVLRPPGLAPELAALTEPVACGVRAAERSGARAGECVIVLGGGPQGQVVCAVLARRGCRVIVCDPHADRRALAQRMGAWRVDDAPRDAEGRARVLRHTPGRRGAHATIAAVGDVAVWESAVALTRPGGEVNFHGGPGPDDVLRLPAARLHYAEITLQASYHHTPATIRRALAMIAAEPGLFAQLLGQEIGLEQVAGALTRGGVKHIVRPRLPLGQSA